MLDCDASFVSVPEFASIRRSLPASLKGATALRDAPLDSVAKSGSAPVQKAERQNGETFTAAMQPAFFDHLPASDMPPIPVPPLADLRAEAAGTFAAPAEDRAPAAGLDLPVPELASPEALADSDPRPVTPRRPLRFNAARGAEDATPVSLPSFNLFEGVFEDGALEGPGIDPRLQRGRARARAHLAAMEAALSPVERNLWHDDKLDTDDQPAPAPILSEDPVMPAPQTDGPQTIVTRAEGKAMPRRPVRQLSPADISRTPRPAPQIHDPLRDRLRDLRDILYTPTPEEAEAAALAAAKPARQPLHQMALALLLPLLALVSALLPMALQAMRTWLRALPQALPSRGFSPRLAAMAAALAAVALPIGLMAPADLLPFL